MRNILHHQVTYSTSLDIVLICNDFWIWFIIPVSFLCCFILKNCFSYFSQDVYKVVFISKHLTGQNKLANEPGSFLWTFGFVAYKCDKEHTVKKYEISVQMPGRCDVKVISWHWFKMDIGCELAYQNEWNMSECIFFHAPKWGKTVAIHELSQIFQSEYIWKIMGW